MHKIFFKIDALEDLKFNLMNAIEWKQVLQTKLILISFYN